MLTLEKLSLIWFFKVHPLERGHFNHAKVIHDIAENSGVKDRVWTVQTMNIGQWVKYSKGIITINSTTGFSAIYHGVPILLLGNAIFDHDKLVYKLLDKNDLDRFWGAEVKASKDQRMRYLDWIRNKSCIKG